MAPLSEILGREMETIGSGENRNAIYNSFENHFSFSKRFPHERQCVTKATEETCPSSSFASRPFLMKAEIWFAKTDSGRA